MGVHNNARKEAGAPVIQWDDELTSNAQKWAEYLVQVDQMQHSSAEQRENQGENLYAASGTDENMILASASKRWADEQEDWRGGEISQDLSAGHYTQMIWTGSDKVGMTAAGPSKKGFIYVVARYSPPGNVMGKKPVE